ncbi:MAG TPA: hypothetical protein VFN26_19965 [Candidatus Acidoferrum sp.]|nr:hypothetical protein [Candidatus Acidoferrum sp.]
MIEKVPEQVPLAFCVGEPSTEPLKTDGGTPFPKVITLWVPRVFLMSSGIDVEALIAEVNEKLSKRRGYVLADGQILTTPVKMTDSLEAMFEGIDPFEVRPHHPWGKAEREYFGLKNPYQMGEHSQEYTYSYITARIMEPYLFSDEKIGAIVHGQKDNYYFYCRCHEAHVVYTTAHRLVCMGCGAMHAVLNKPLSFQPKRLLTAQEWADFFDEDGCRHEEEVDLSILDFREVETAGMLWTTDQWEEAKCDFLFFARSSPEEIEEEIRRTQPDPSELLEAGWKPVPTVPPPAFQVVGSIDVDLVENARHAIAEGVSSYLAARKVSEKLVNAIPQLFRGTELLLKARLLELDRVGLRDEPNNLTVLKRLAAKGVRLQDDELTNLKRLRRWRNELQHGTARFNHRAALATCRRAIILLDRFSHAQLGLWLGEALPDEDWHRLLGIREIAITAELVVARQLDETSRDPNVEVSECLRCHRRTLVRPHAAMGARCIYCGYIPVQKEQD